MVALIYVNGVVTQVAEKFVVVEANGIGWLMQVADPKKYEANAQVKAYVYKHLANNSVKQDITEELYAFAELEERDFFAMLVTVPGVGPRTAMAMFRGDWRETRQKIANRDIQGLQATPGIRPNAAINMVDALAYKLSTNKSPANLRLSRAAQSLRVLGYRQEQIDYALGTVDREGAEIEQLIADAIRAIAVRDDAYQSKAR